MATTEAVIAAAKGGAIVGLAVGALPLAVGLFHREYKRTLVATSACVLAGALGGVHAVTPVAIASLFAIMRSRGEHLQTHDEPGLVFKYGRLSAFLSFLGIAVMALVSGILIAAAFFVIALSDVGSGDKLLAVVGGLTGIAFAYVFALWARNWHALLSEYTLTAYGVTIRTKSSSQFVPWGSLVHARHRRTLKQIDLEFMDCPDRVILTNVDMDPEASKILEAVALVERMTGRSVPRSWF